jgi:hypothetical protein
VTRFPSIDDLPKEEEVCEWSINSGHNGGKIMTVDSSLWYQLLFLL